MIIRKTSFYICLTTLILCLAAGYALSGKWVGAASVVPIGLFWLFSQKYSTPWLAYFCLVISMALAVIGQLIGNSAILMIFSAGLALAVWDLMLLNNTSEKGSAGAQTHRYESKHLQSLALAVGSGLAVAFLGRQLHFRLPFILMLLCVALAVFGLNFVWNSLKNRITAEK